MSVKGGKHKTKAKNPGITISATDLSLTIKQSGLYRDVLFVPPSMPAADLLLKMQASHVHMAIVIDEYGGSDGLISIEDLVEEIVGDISDEHDTDEDNLIKPHGDGVYVALGRVDIARLEELLDVDLLSDEDDEETDTLAGLVFKMAGRVPTRGEILRHPSGLEFEILESDPRRVKRLRIKAKKAIILLDTCEAGVLYVNRRAGATTGAWPGVQAFGGWKGSGSTGKSGLSMYYVAQFLREQSHTVVD
jgi:CBS domain containing-hemolysin-like protein